MPGEVWRRQDIVEFLDATEANGDLAVHDGVGHRLLDLTDLWVDTPSTLALGSTTAATVWALITSPVGNSTSGMTMARMVRSECWLP